ncbi:hypothetical protein F4604DRAFT_901783 [Suillus subluteus]|nr:hypothetical protein F4604DRAFT_901783 [Suillus subluteus]
MHMLSLTLLRFFTVSSRHLLFRQLSYVVICLVEIKPKSLQAKNFGFSSAAMQISRQAYFAFMGDSTLTTIGVILAFGNVYKYVEFPLPLANLPSTWSEYQDTTFVSLSNLHRPVPRVPSYLKKLSGNKDVFRFDRSSRTI